VPVWLKILATLLIIAVTIAIATAVVAIPLLLLQKHLKRTDSHNRLVQRVPASGFISAIAGAAIAFALIVALTLAPTDPLRIFLWQDAGLVYVIAGFGGTVGTVWFVVAGVKLLMCHIRGANDAN